MLANAVQDKIKSTGAQKILRLLDPLKRTPGGSTLYEHIARSIQDSELTHADIEQGYASLVSMLIEAYSKQIPNGSPLKIHLKLLQMRLTPPLSPSEIITLQDYVKEVTEALNKIAVERDSGLTESILPLLESFGISTAGMSSMAPAAAAVSAPKAVTPAKAEPAETIPEASLQAAAPITEEKAPAAPSREIAIERRVDLSYRQHLDEKRKGIQQIQESLANQVTECVKQNDEFGSLLEEELSSLQQISSGEDVEVMRHRLIQKVDKLLHRHNDIADKLERTGGLLRIVETDSQQLSDELARVHLLSLTDELTGLPNRRAFLRRLQDEVARVQRYGNPLSLALIDLDGFKSINDKRGHAAGDEVLRVFAKDILTIFRHHDLVARYGGEEFAVLLPNTHKEGALRALRKVQKRAAETTYQYGGVSTPLPTLSAGLALYRPGESTDALIERADHVLYRAKRLGRNRIESDQQEGSSTASV